MNDRHLHELAQPIFTVDVCITHGENVLMLKRSETKKAFPGWLALPGGHIEANEDPLAAAIREVREETGIAVSPAALRQKFVAVHHHLDRKEVYIVFGFLVNLGVLDTPVIGNHEGTLVWMDKKTLLASDTVLPPVKYYLHHLLTKQGILYNNSTWSNATLVAVNSETLDSNS